MTPAELRTAAEKATKGPWRVGYHCMDIGCENAKIGGFAKLFDVRGWGYLTGTGHGGLGMSEAAAIEMQTANATLAALCSPDNIIALLDALAAAERERPLR